nr:hypothetical protein GCM10020093_051330 [Planobispora longispora]
MLRRAGLHRLLGLRDRQARREGLPQPGEDFRCGIHRHLRQRGFTGCTVYDCFGAGQKISQITFGGVDWRRAPGTAGRMFEVFPVMRNLHELLWYLTEALTLRPARPIHAEIRRARDEVERLTHDGPDALLKADVAAHRREAGELLQRASELARAGVRGKKKERRGADLIGAKLKGADLRGANLRGPTSSEPTCAGPTCGRPTSSEPISAAPTCGAPTSPRASSSSSPSSTRPRATPPRSCPSSPTPLTGRRREPPIMIDAVGHRSASASRRFQVGSLPVLPRASAGARARADSPRLADGTNIHGPRPHRWCGGPDSVGGDP